MILLPYKDKWPKISRKCYVAETATLVGDVTLGEESSVWFGAVIRADGAAIRIGKRSNIQDNCVIHAHSGHPIYIGNKVSIAHGAKVHGARIGSNTSIGMGTVMLTGSEVGSDCEIGAGLVLFKDVKIPKNTVLYGNFETTPKKVTKERSKMISGYANDQFALSRYYLQ